MRESRWQQFDFVIVACALGLILTFVAGYWSGGLQWASVVVFSILILTLVFRPTGLLGMRVAER